MWDNRGLSYRDPGCNYLPLLRGAQFQSSAAYLWVKNKFLLDLNPCSLKIRCILQSDNYGNHKKTPPKNLPLRISNSFYIFFSNLIFLTFIFVILFFGDPETWVFLRLADQSFKSSIFFRKFGMITLAFGRISQKNTLPHIK